MLYRLRVLLGFRLDGVLPESQKCKTPPGFSKFIDTFSGPERSIFRLVFAAFHAVYLDVTDYYPESAGGDIFQEHMSGLRDTLEHFMEGGSRNGKAQQLRQQGPKPDADHVSLWILLFLNDRDVPEGPCSQIEFQALKPVIIVRDLALTNFPKPCE